MMAVHRHPLAMRRIAVVATCLLATVLAAGQASSASAAVPGSVSRTDAAVAALPALKVVTIGDSIMNGFGLPAGAAWPFLVAAKDGWTLTNAACDGAGVIAVGSSAECNSTFAGIVDSVSSLDPDIVIFEGSSNDFGQDNSDLLSATISDLRSLKSEFPSAQIVGLSTLWGYTDPPAQLAEVNDEVEQAVKAVGGMYLDIGQPMSGHPELMQADDVHPNAAGQAVLATTITAAVQTAMNRAVKDQREEIVRQAGIAELLRTGRLR